jgi:hypothetical protein
MTGSSRVSSTLRSIDFIIGASEYWIARFPRAMTAGAMARSYFETGSIFKQPMTIQL